MKILWMTWKDLLHPQAGGAELINEEIAKRLARDGHEVTLLVSSFPGCKDEEQRDGYRIVRMGNRYSVYWKAYRYYKKNLVGWADLVIDEMNTIPFFCKFYVQERNILLAYQLCREIWFYQIFFPLNIIGYLIEPIYLWLLSDRFVITESESAKKDMQRFGFRKEKIQVMPVGIKEVPVESLVGIEKYSEPTLLSLGAIRAMKKTLDQIEAFEIAKEKIPNLKLKIAGGISGNYGRRFLQRIGSSRFSKDIEYLGRVDAKTKIEVMQKSHFILVTSVKEGWGLIVTEANGQGTPAVVYDVDGLRDSVRHQETGMLVDKNAPQALADQVVSGLQNSEEYSCMRERAWNWSREFTLERCYQKFVEFAAVEKGSSSKTR
jgi:glycosyltransferase involved in cell wall biosynthesis